MSVSDETEHQHRRSTRLAGYDYAQDGVYFVTICTQERTLYFADEVVREIAARHWRVIPEHSPMADLDEWVVMPNHVHGLIVIGGRGGMGEQGVLANAPTRTSAVSGDRVGGQAFPYESPSRDTLGDIVRAYKAAVTASCRRAGYVGFGWQRGFYDRIVRNERELNAIRRYIIDNPQRWSHDEHFPANHARKKPLTSTSGRRVPSGR